MMIQQNPTKSPNHVHSPWDTADTNALMVLLSDDPYLDGWDVGCVCIIQQWLNASDERFQYKTSQCAWEKIEPWTIISYF